MEKLDLAKKYKAYYTAKPRPELVDIEAAQFLSISGQGDPSGQPYADKVGALYAAAYTLKFACKALGKDFTVAKLEGLWSYDEQRYGQVSMKDAPILIPRSEWTYRMMIRLPDYVSPAQVQEAIETAAVSKQIPLAREIELFSMQEGKVVQMLHLGPFDTEPESLLQIQTFIDSQGLQKNGLHHEIYLSDFRKTAPEKLKTILREPVR